MMLSRQKAWGKMTTLSLCLGILGCGSAVLSSTTPHGSVQLLAAEDPGIEIQAQGRATLDQFETVEIESLGRTYHIHKPATITDNLPLVVVLHGGGGYGAGVRDTYGFKPIIQRGEVIAVYPDGVETTWVAGDLPVGNGAPPPAVDDVTFLDTVIQQVLQSEPVDPTRIFVTGASRGGLMTLYYLPRTSMSIRAAGSVISGMTQNIATDFQLPQPVDFAFINGTLDPLMPYNGSNKGDPRYRLLPIEQAAQLIREANDITGLPLTSTLGNPVRRDRCRNTVRLWSNEQTGARVSIVKVIGGGHVVPGGRQYLPKWLIGPLCEDFDHAEAMWEFFKSAQPR